MKRYQKIIGLMVVFCLFVLAGCNGSGSKLRKPLNWDLETFQFTNQDGKQFGTKNLKGKVWVADFMFTNCQTVCPPMTANMAKLQKMAKEEKLDVQFVSFSVDPDLDKPANLKAFIQKFTEDTSNWNLLTGYSLEDITKFSKDNFQSLVDKPENGQVMHGTSFYLIDQNGKVMKKYNGISNTPYEDIIRDMKRLVD